MEEVKQFWLICAIQSALSGLIELHSNSLQGETREGENAISKRKRRVMNFETNISQNLKNHQNLQPPVPTFPAPTFPALSMYFFIKHIVAPLLTNFDIYYSFRIQ